MTRHNSGTGKWAALDVSATGEFFGGGRAAHKIVAAIPPPEILATW